MKASPFYPQNLDFPKSVRGYSLSVLGDLNGSLHFRKNADAGRNAYGEASTLMMME
jgi:hypothetical protein